MAGDPGPVPAGQAEFNTMHDLAIDGAGNLWIADSKNNLVRVLFDPANAPALGAAAPPATQPPASQPPGSQPPGSQPPAATSGQPVPNQSGYWMLGNDGKIFPFGDARSLGDPSAALPAGTKAVRLEPTPTTGGLLGAQRRRQRLRLRRRPARRRARRRLDLGKGEKATSLSATPTGKGYWIFTTKGRVFPFGDAKSFGDLAKLDLNGAVQSSVATPSG